MVNHWAHAWSNKSVGEYLGYYAPDFKTPKGEPRAEWEKFRKERIHAPKKILVSVSGAKVTLKNETHASVTFRQRYKADTLNSATTKTLVLVNPETNGLFSRARRRLSASPLVASSRMGRAFALFRHRGKLLVLCAWLVLLPLAEPPATAMGSRPHPAQGSGDKLPNSPEALLVQSLIDIQGNRLDAALKQIDKLLTLNPNFRLAHLIKGDLLMARARPIATIGNASGVPANRLSDLRDERGCGCQHYLDPAPLDLVPEYLLQFEPNQHHAVVVVHQQIAAVSKNDNGEPRYVADTTSPAVLKVRRSWKATSARRSAMAMSWWITLPKAKVD